MNSDTITLDKNSNELIVFIGQSLDVSDNVARELLETLYVAGQTNAVAGLGIQQESTDVYEGKVIEEIPADAAETNVDREEERMKAISGLLGFSVEQLRTINGYDEVPVAPKKFKTGFNRPD